MSCVVRGAGATDAGRGRAQETGELVNPLRGLPYRLINLFPDNPCYSSEKRYLGKILLLRPIRITLISSVVP